MDKTKIYKIHWRYQATPENWTSYTGPFENSDGTSKDYSIMNPLEHQFIKISSGETINVNTIISFCERTLKKPDEGCLDHSKTLLETAKKNGKDVEYWTRRLQEDAKKFGEEIIEYNRIIEVLGIDDEKIIIKRKWDQLKGGWIDE